MKYILTIFLFFSFSSTVLADMSVFGTGKQDSSGYVEVSAKPAADSFVNITTATDTDVCQAGCAVTRVIVGTGEAASTLALYNDADGTCTSDLITTLDTATAGVFSIGLNTSIGLCAKSVGLTTGNVTIITK